MTTVFLNSVDKCICLQWAKTQWLPWQHLLMMYKCPSAENGKGEWSDAEAEWSDANPSLVFKYRLLARLILFYTTSLAVKKHLPAAKQILPSVAAVKKQDTSECFRECPSAENGKGKHREPIPLLIYIISKIMSVDNGVFEQCRQMYLFTMGKNTVVALATFAYDV